MPGLASYTIGSIPGSSPSMAALIPRGVIWMWSGRFDQIPAGWAICDGTQGTPNLLDRFVKGVPTRTTLPGTTGGATTHLHAHSATHSHELPLNIISGGWGSVASLGTGASATRIRNFSDASGSGSAAREKSNAVAPGSTDSADGRPPWFEIAYIMKL